MDKTYSVGLDIGTTKIVAMVGQKNQFYKVKVKTPKDVLEWMDLSPMNIELLVTQKNNW